MKRMESDGNVEKCLWSSEGFEERKNLKVYGMLQLIYRIRNRRNPQTYKSWVCDRKSPFGFDNLALRINPKVLIIDEFWALFHARHSSVTAMFQVSIN